VQSEKDSFNLSDQSDWNNGKQSGFVTEITAENYQRKLQMVKEPQDGVQKLPTCLIVDVEKREKKNQETQEKSRKVKAVNFVH
jgi:hypothetical protein